jgi:hypothetical protein
MARRSDGTAYGKRPRKRTNARETHGYHAAQRFLAEYGARALDQRTRAAKDLAAWKAAYLEDLGGVENVSTATLTELEIAAFEWFLWRGLAVSVASKDAPSQEEINLLRRLGDSLGKHFDRIGRERWQPPPQDLTAYIEQRYPGDDN